MNLHSITATVSEIILWVVNETHAGRCNHNEEVAGPRSHHRCADYILTNIEGTRQNNGTIYCECDECYRTHIDWAHYIRSTDDNVAIRYRCNACLTGFHPVPPA